jgi:hypothetical protein
MPDMTAISGAIASLNAAVNITKAMKDLRDGSIVQSKVIELQSAILDAQNSLFSANEERATLIQKVGQLEKQLADTEAWEAEKQRYQMTEAGPGVFAYILKPAMRGSEPSHYVCANCYRLRKISVLQHVRVHGIGDFMECAACNTKTCIEEGYRPAA